ncbi:MAG TPA: SDR family NAD(P)-dependent oxidoreductase [Aestuariivirgaceae bacterium]|jgi:NAD(P)-dependent dehydrogenase (short-subunit alcohol dehydrogenase family)|nr:SDR family NAD(P)-dependent oxidoreductase [Aestuariivirgaceae bacterium]
MRLKDRVALVTGAARGIGLAAARAFLEEGARVTLCDIDEAPLQAVVADLLRSSLPVQAVPVDVSDRASIVSAVAATIAAWGQLDVLVSNAAITDDTPLAAISPEQWRRVLAVNLDGVLFCAQAAVPHLRHSVNGSIINIASIQGLRGQPDAMAYATAKAGVVNLTRCMAVDLGPLGIRANAIAPGFIDTRMALMHGSIHEHQTDWFNDVFIKHGRLPLRRPGKPEDVAGPILFLASDDSRYVTGHVLVVDGGLTCTY